MVAIFNELEFLRSLALIDLDLTDAVVIALLDFILNSRV